MSWSGLVSRVAASRRINFIALFYPWTELSKKNGYDYVWVRKKLLGYVGGQVKHLAIELFGIYKGKLTIESSLRS